MTKKLTLSQLSNLLFRACDDLRGNMMLQSTGATDRCGHRRADVPGEPSAPAPVPRKDADLNETLAAVFKAVEGSTKGTASEAPFVGLFDDLDVLAHQY